MQETEFQTSKGENNYFLSSGPRDFCGKEIYAFSRKDTPFFGLGGGLKMQGSPGPSRKGFLGSESTLFKKEGAEKGTGSSYLGHAEDIRSLKGGR